MADDRQTAMSVGIDVDHHFSDRLGRLPG